MKIKASYLLRFLAIMFLPCGLRAQDSGRPLDYCFLSNGDVVVTDGGRKIADIQPHVFSGFFSGGFFQNSALFEPVGPGRENGNFNQVALVRGVTVDMGCEVGRLANGLHFHYQLIPRQTVTVSQVEIYAVFPYADWMKAPFEFNDNEGFVPDQPTPGPGGDGWVIRQADSAPISVGPSTVLGGLEFQMTSPGLHLTLADDRFYGKNMSMVYSHRESGEDWTWEKGQVKEFAFDLTFNRPMAESPCSSPTQTPSGPRLPTATPTITPTPYPPDCLDTLVDDFDDPSRNTSEGRFNRWGGRWTATCSRDGSVNAAYASPGYGNSSYCASVTGENPRTEEGGESLYKADFFGNGAPFNARVHGITGIRLHMKGDGNSYWIDLFSAAHPNDSYCFNIVPPEGVWTDFKLSFNELALKSWWGSKTGNPTYTDGSDLTGIGVEAVNGGPFAFSLGQVSFYRESEPYCPAPHVPQEPTLAFTPTPTRTWTPRPTFTPTWTATFTPRPTATPVFTATPKPMPAFISKPIPSPAWNAVPKIPTLPFPQRGSGTASKTGSLYPTKTVRGPTPSLPKIKPAPARIWRRAAPTPGPVPPSPTALPARNRFKELPPAPTLGPGLSLGQTLVFTAPPANIYVDFADGPGRYQVLVTDSAGNALEVIYDHRVVSETDAWLEWDGKDGRGEDVQPGLYYVIIYRNEKALKRLALLLGSPK